MKRTTRAEGDRTQLCRRVAPLLGLCLLVASCGNGNPDRPAPSLTRTARPSPSLSLPTRSPDEPSSTRPDASAAPTGGPTSSPAGPTQAPTTPAPTRTPTTPTPTPTPTRTPTTPTPTPSNTPTVVPSASESPAGTGAPSDGSAESGTGVPPWAWWVLGLLAVALAVGIPLVVRSRRRAAWSAELATASEDVAWFSRVLLPQLQAAGSVEQLAGGWAVGLPRVAAVEDQLVALGATARTDPDRARAGRLRDAVRTARDGIDDVVAARGPEPFHQALGALASGLEEALAPAQA